MLCFVDASETRRVITMVPLYAARVIPINQIMICVSHHESIRIR